MDKKNSEETRSKIQSGNKEPFGNNTEKRTFSDRIESTVGAIKSMNPFKSRTKIDSVVDVDNRPDNEVKPDQIKLSTYFDSIETIPIPFDVPSILFKEIVDTNSNFDINMLRPNQYFENLLTVMKLLQTDKIKVFQMTKTNYESLSEKKVFTYDLIPAGSSLNLEEVETFDYKTCEITVNQDFKKINENLVSMLDVLNKSTEGDAVIIGQSKAIYNQILKVSSFLGPYLIRYGNNKGMVIAGFDIPVEIFEKFNNNNNTDLQLNKNLKTYGGSIKTKAYRPRRQRKSRRRVVKRKVPKSKT
jgi:hypothetical protein